MKKQINIKLPILPGSISTAMSKCGKKKCSCKENPPKLHGPYFRWTGIIDGKRTTVTLSKEEAEECKRRIKNYRNLLKFINNLTLKGIKTAPWL